MIRNWYNQFVIHKSHKQFFSWGDSIITEVALFSNTNTILVLLEINDNGYLQCCWNPKLNKDYLLWLVDFKSGWKGNDQEPIQSNSTSYPRHQSEKEQKDEQYQLELPEIETQPWNDHYKINGGVGGGGLKSVYRFLPLRIYAGRTFMSRDFSLHIALLLVT